MTTVPNLKMPLLTALLRPFLVLKEALSVGDDYWTWYTRQGQVYEDVVVVKMNPNEVTIRHKYGTAIIGRCDLSPQIQKGLIDSFEMSEPDFAYSGASEHDRYLSAMPMAHAK